MNRSILGFPETFKDEQWHFFGSVHWAFLVCFIAFAHSHQFRCHQLQQTRASVRCHNIQKDSCWSLQQQNDAEPKQEQALDFPKQGFHYVLQFLTSWDLHSTSVVKFPLGEATLDVWPTTNKHIKRKAAIQLTSSILNIVRHCGIICNS